MRKVYVGLIAFLVIGILMQVTFAGDSDSVIVTYGETTQSNPEFKEIVNNYFKDNAHVDIANTNNKIITSKNINDLINSFTNQSYTPDQVFTSICLDLNGNKNLKVNSNSNITLITAKMYESALKSAGINKGDIYITSPVKNEGESAIDGILSSYESVTNVEIPGNVEKAANHEIYAQAEIVKNSNLTTKELTSLVSAVKNKVIVENISNHTEIVKIINKNLDMKNLTMSDNDIENLADAIGEVQSVQKDAKNYENKLSGFLGGSCKSEYSLYDFINWINSL